MAYLDTLEILITADRGGLESQLKRALTSVDQFINNVGKDGIDWKQIFTKGFTPSVIAGVASTMAMALSQIITFQNEMAKNAQTTGEQTEGSLDAIGSQALGIVSSTGVSLGTVNEALTKARKEWKDTAMQTLVAKYAALEASVGMGKASEIVEAFSYILKKFGITDTPTAARSLDVLSHAAKESTIDYMDFLGTVKATSVGFDKAGISLDDLATGLSVYSNQTGITSDMAVKMFTKMAEAVNKSDDGLNLVFGGLDTIQGFLRQGGIPYALEQIRKKFQEGGIVAQKLGDLAGFDAKEISSMSKTSVIDINTMTTAMAGMNKETLGLQKGIEAVESPINKLEKRVTKFWAGVVSTATGAASELEAILEAIEEGKTGTYFREVIEGEKIILGETVRGENKIGAAIKGKPKDIMSEWFKGTLIMFDELFNSGTPEFEKRQQSGYSDSLNSPAFDKGLNAGINSMGQGIGYTFNNTFLIGSGSGIDSAVSIAKELNNLMHKQ
jgi:hypothetical protein